MLTYLLISNIALLLCVAILAYIVNRQRNRIEKLEDEVAHQKHVIVSFGVALDIIKERVKDSK